VSAGSAVSGELVARARDVLRHAYAPYSEFRVGAALAAADGRVFVGTNVESASYGVTICAERMALGAAVAAGARRFTLLAVATEVDPPAAPCGACRQLLAEFGTDLEVIAAGPATERRWTLAQLLPDAFTRKSLDR
jgi:cytidine deaminase